MMQMPTKSSMQRRMLSIHHALGWSQAGVLVVTRIAVLCLIGCQILGMSIFAIEKFVLIDANCIETFEFLMMCGGAHSCLSFASESCLEGRGPCF